MSPQDWGWKESDGALIPVTTDLAPAPNERLQIVRCNCQTDCSTLRCSCRKHGLNCRSLVATVGDQGVAIQILKWTLMMKLNN